jgi:hypothetical protein
VTLAHLVRLAGVAQLAVLVASALVPVRLDWKRELAGLTPLHRQMYWTYGGYVVLAIVAFGATCLAVPGEIAARGPLARCLCGYIAAFWGIRCALQAVFAVGPHLTTWWLRGGYHLLSLLFAALTVLFAYLAITGAPGG